MTLSSIALIGVPAATADEQQTTAEQNTAAKPSVIINEVYAGNTKAAGDPDSKRCDWAELKNTGSTDVDVKGWGIYDSGKKAKKHYTIGASEVTNTDTVIKAGGYLVHRPRQGKACQNLRCRCRYESLLDQERERQSDSHDSGHFEL